MKDSVKKARVRKSEMFNGHWEEKLKQKKRGNERMWVRRVGKVSSALPALVCVLVPGVPQSELWEAKPPTVFPLSLHSRARCTEWALFLLLWATAPVWKQSAFHQKPACCNRVVGTGVKCHTRTQTNPIKNTKIRMCCVLRNSILRG